MYFYISGVNEEVETVWVTAVVAAYLQKAYPRQKTNWELVVNKAGRFITKASKSLSVQVDFVGEAAKFVKAN